MLHEDTIDVVLRPQDARVFSPPDVLSETSSLLADFASMGSRRSVEANRRTLELCRILLERDDLIQEVCNPEGLLCSSYPESLLIPRSGLGFDLQHLERVFHSSRFARVHGRFVVPVILVNGKYICRSSTTSIEADTVLKNMKAKAREFLSTLYKEDRDYVHSCGSLSLEEQQLADVEALDLFRVSHICDLMVENFKKVYGVSVTSSEKVKRSLYRECSISSIPYPGCEFFRVYHAKDFEMTSLYYDWDAEFNTTVLEVADPIPRFCGHWHGEYKSWDLITMTSNYLSYVLSLVHSKDPNVSGVLVHCISGWDRTPLFISLLRMSLWADGLIHKSLSAEEMLFFTLAYDWLLFGHHFADRLQKTEDILHFCFNFLIHIAKDVTASAPIVVSRSTPRSPIIPVPSEIPVNLVNDRRPSIGSIESHSFSWEVVSVKLSGSGDSCSRRHSFLRGIESKEDVVEQSDDFQDFEQSLSMPRTSDLLFSMEDPDTTHCMESFSSREEKLLAIRQLFLELFRSCCESRSTSKSCSSTSSVSVLE